MAARTAVALAAHFQDLEDPRIDRTKLHRLTDIIAIAFRAVLCGADSWVEVQKFGGVSGPLHAVVSYNRRSVCAEAPEVRRPPRFAEIARGSRGLVQWA